MPLVFERQNSSRIINLKLKIENVKYLISYKENYYYQNK